MPTFGPDSSGEFLKSSPIDYLDALPVTGSYIGHLVNLTTGSVGLYSWDGASWVGPFGTGGGGGGGAPTTADYLVRTADAGLSAERVVTDTSEVTWDWATGGQAKANVGAIAQSKVTNLVSDLAGKVPTTRTISTTAPLTGGGDLSANRTLAVSDATTTTKGVVELATSGENAANVVVQGNDSRLSDSRAPNGAASGDLTGTYPGPTVAADAITDTKLRDSSALSVIGRSDNSVGDPADIATTSGSNNVLRETGGALAWGKIGSATIAAGAVDTAALANLNVTLGKIARKPGGGPGLMTADLTGDAEWKGPANFPAIPWFRDGSTEVAFPRWSGTTFPTSVADGQHFYHTTHNVAYSYNSAVSGWLSIGVYEFPFGNSADITNAAGVQFAEFGEVAANATFSATLGHLYGFATKVIGISLNMATSGTCTIQVTDDGAEIGSSAELTLTAVQSGAVETLLSTTIAANSILGVAVTSGTAEGPFRGMVRLRRFET
jgi:hypothetical protein